MNYSDYQRQGVGTVARFQVHLLRFPAYIVFIQDDESQSSRACWLSMSQVSSDGHKILTQLCAEN